MVLCDEPLRDESFVFISEFQSVCVLGKMYTGQRACVRAHVWVLASVTMSRCVRAHECVCVWVRVISPCICVCVNARECVCMRACTLEL